METSNIEARRKTEEAAARATAMHAADAALDNKAENVTILDVRGKIDYADYIVIAGGRSERHVNGIAERIQRAVRTDLRVHCNAIEDLPQGRWALLDFGDVIVHIFHEDARGYYDLENLWMDATRVPCNVSPSLDDA